MTCYNFNIKNSQVVNSKNASIQYFSKKKGTKGSGKQELFEKGLKKFSQGYTVNKLAKEGLLNPSKEDQYVKVIKSKNKVKRPNSSKKRKVAPYENRYSMHVRNHKPGLLSHSVGLYNGNTGDRNRGT